MKFDEPHYSSGPIPYEGGQVCPHCGHCPTCGRHWSGFHYSYPPFSPLPAVGPNDATGPDPIVGDARQEAASAAQEPARPEEGYELSGDPNPYLEPKRARRRRRR